jgi:hypothetical protein
MTMRVSVCRCLCISATWHARVHVGPKCAHQAAVHNADQQRPAPPCPLPLALSAQSCGCCPSRTMLPSLHAAEQAAAEQAAHLTHLLSPPPPPHTHNTPSRRGRRAQLPRVDPARAGLPHTVGVPLLRHQHKAAAAQVRRVRAGVCGSSGQQPAHLLEQVGERAGGLGGLLGWGSLVHSSAIASSFGCSACMVLHQACSAWSFGACCGGGPGAARAAWPGHAAARCRAC